ncbi:ABC transporter ATP-binding protein [Anaerococcus sp. Marseille-Q5996]|uniref:ABC transporter ATP-binding protein n=1 Tax=Anaerococcus sp. Marseille-Q5996 TaxID=2972769 RepID=UPI0021C86F59|nr:ATP-binding cassette domain-containing protein [Anaerococcus sp. Marseille-Q5996]
MKHIELNNISKAYGNRKIIDDLSFSIDENEIVAIVGKSGSGKSTLLNMIGLLETYDSGEILLKGEKLPNLNSKEATLLRRNEINYLFQTNALISEKTVRENLKLAMEYVDIKDEEKFEKISEVLDRLDILDTIDQKANTVSGGEAQRVALARCILKPGDLILADEPTGSLDPKMSDKVFSLLLGLRNDYNKTILVVTHDMDIAKKCDRMIDINK